MLLEDNLVSLGTEPSRGFTSCTKKRSIFNGIQMESRVDCVQTVSV